MTSNKATHTRHRSQRHTLCIQFGIIIILGAILSGIIGGVTSQISKWDTKSTEVVTGVGNATILGNATIIEKRDCEQHVWHGCGGHRGEEKVVRLERRCWQV
jgi:hypothetical protein